MDQKLQNLVDNVYKGIVHTEGLIGDGTLGDTVRYELRTGQQVYGSYHSIKAEQTINGLQNWLANNPGALAVDRRVAEDILYDLQNALAGR
jgi:hypothetical protein